MIKPAVNLATLFSLCLLQVSCSSSSQRPLLPTGTSASAAVQSAPTSPTALPTSTTAQHILHTADRMIQRGITTNKGCWDHLDKVYHDAGVPRSARFQAFNGHRKGPYASLEQIRVGDWLHYNNLGYGGEHSGIFIGWVDRSRYIANILSHPGEGRTSSGRYRHYDVSQVWRIVRAKAG